MRRLRFGLSAGLALLALQIARGAHWISEEGYDAAVGWLNKRERERQYAAAYEESLTFDAPEFANEGWDD